MAKKVTWSQRMLPKDRDFVDEILENYMTEKGLNSKSDALVRFFRDRVHIEPQDSETIIPEIRYVKDEQFEETCPFGFLKRITGSYGREERWHCLKQQGPDNKGKPVLIADGNDKQSIRTICEACQINWQRKPQKLDQIRIVFQQLGESEITSKLYFCIRDAIDEDIKFSPTEHVSWYCTEKRKKVTIKNTCIANKCPYFVQKIVSLSLSETIPYTEAQKALEVLE